MTFLRSLCVIQQPHITIVNNGLNSIKKKKTNYNNNNMMRCNVCKLNEYFHNTSYKNG